MGTHPIFESDFDCLTERDMEVVEYSYSTDKRTLECLTFDATVKATWSRIASAGLMRYEQQKRNEHATYIDGTFVFQYLANRASLRRSRVQFDSIDEPFSPDRFHFGKINDNEKMFELMKNGINQATAIVNVSPIEWGHFLLVPKLDANLQQRLTFDSIRIGLEMINLSTDVHFRLMFNSLLAWASVNHFHYHCFTYPAELIAEYPLKALCVCVRPNEADIESKSCLLSRLVDVFYELDIAHNVVIVRSSELITRFFIFPRRKADTAIVSKCVDPACVEFSGQFPCKDEAEWRELTTAGAFELLGSVRLDLELENELFRRLE